MLSDFPPGALLRRQGAEGWQDFRVVGPIRLGIFTGLQVALLADDGSELERQEITLSEASVMTRIA